MSDKPENPLAFACPASHADNGSDGMSLRDYFAAKAMQGMLASPHLREAYAMEKSSLAAICFGVADAMLKARGE